MSRQAQLPLFGGSAARNDRRAKVESLSPPSVTRHRVENRVTRQPLMGRSIPGAEIFKNDKFDYNTQISYYSVK